MNMLNHPIVALRRAVPSEDFNLELSATGDLILPGEASRLCIHGSINLKLKILHASILAAAEAYSKQLDLLASALNLPPVA